MRLSIEETRVPTAWVRDGMMNISSAAHSAMRHTRDITMEKTLLYFFRIPFPFVFPISLSMKLTGMLRMKAVMKPSVIVVKPVERNDVTSLSADVKFWRNVYSTMKNEPRSRTASICFLFMRMMIVSKSFYFNYSSFGLYSFTCTTSE